MNPKRFLALGGAILVLLGILGIAGLLEQISTVAFFHPPHWINWFHLSLGLVILAVLFSKNEQLQTDVTLFGTIILLTIGILGLTAGMYFGDLYNIKELADPSDHIVHLAVGLLALWGYVGRKHIN